MLDDTTGTNLASVAQGGIVALGWVEGGWKLGVGLFVGMFICNLGLAILHSFRSDRAREAQG
jgi:hypothetical protein